MKFIYKFFFIVFLIGFLVVCKEDFIEVDVYGSFEGILFDEEIFEFIFDVIIIMVFIINVFIFDEQGRFFIDFFVVDNYIICIKVDGYWEGFQNVEIEFDWIC